MKIKGRTTGEIIFETDFNDLRGADLAGADLAGADLAGADLAGADLAGANLVKADLARANLTGADLPAPTAVLLANWGPLPDWLTVEAMRFDAACHPAPEMFDIWASDGDWFADWKAEQEKRRVRIAAARIWLTRLESSLCERGATEEESKAVPGFKWVRKGEKGGGVEPAVERELADRK